MSDKAALPQPGYWPWRVPIPSPPTASQYAAVCAGRCPHTDGRDGPDNACNGSPGVTALPDTRPTSATNSGHDGQTGKSDADFNDDSAASPGKPAYQQTADWTTGSDTTGNGKAGDEILAKARALAAPNAEQAT